MYNIYGDDMKFQVLASGSRGNLTYIETEKTKILLDAGISLKAIRNRTQLDLHDIDAIVVTHEHTDHVFYLEKLALFVNAPIYMNKESFFAAKEKYFKTDNDFDVRFIEANKKYTIGDINFVTMNLNHDTKCCYGYIFVSGTKSLGYCTDTGFIPLPYLKLLQNVDSLIIEANHDVELLQNSDRPWDLIQRILSPYGHMSNLVCGEVLARLLKAKKIKRVVLAHLSEECNSEDIALNTIKECIKDEYLPELHVAKQKEATDLFEV